MAKQQERAKLSGAQHVLVTIKSTGRQMVLAGLLTGIIAALLVEAYGAYATGSFTTPSTQVFALVFALVGAYGAIVTVLLRGVIATLVDSIEWVSGEVQRLAGGIVQEAESVLHVSDEHDATYEPVGSVSNPRP
ncbi:MAG TPA: hypothetical protein VGS80_20245 [Ktedonobacterales bacterium]|nr:hypothetical protein [Ktedonobacterales bacterium]